MRPQQTAPLTHWVLRLASLIDSRDPGFLGELYRAQTARRQVVFAALAALPVATLADRALRQLGRRLRLERSERVITQAYGSDPSGFRNALAKLGSRPAKAAFYPQLHAEFAAPSGGHRLRLLRHLPALDPAQIARLDRLDPVAWQPNLVALLATEDDVASFAALLDGVRRHCPTVEDGTLREVLARVRSREQLGEALTRLFGRATLFPAPPFSGSERLEPLVSGQAMSDAARRFTNCLASKIVEVLDGSTFLYLWHGSGGPLVVGLVRCSGVWQLDEIKGPKNRDVPLSVRRAVEADLLACGYRRGPALAEAMAAFI